MLRWIVAGCPDGVMAGDTHKTTAVALKGRRLVIVSKKRGIWSAAATDAGRYFVKYGKYPDGHWLAESTHHKVSTPSKTKPETTAGQTARKVTGLRPVDQFIADLVAAGGTLHIEQDDNNYYENLANLATRYNKVPADKLLQVRRGRRYGQKDLELVDKPGWMTTVLDPLPIPERLTRPHPAIVTLRSDRESRLRFKREPRQRALLLLNALTLEATRRGYTVACPAQGRHDAAPKYDVTVEVNGHAFELSVHEETDKIPHEPTAKELRDFETRGWPRIPKYDHVPSGRLRIDIGRGFAVRQSGFGDTKTLNLNDRLPYVLQEVELRAAVAEARRLQKEREDAERRRQWEDIRAHAMVSHREHHRAEVLHARASQWQTHDLLTRYAAAVSAEVETLDGEDRGAAAEWLTWVTGHLEETRPFRTPPTTPATPDPKPDDLKPFMKGLSPYGPDDQFRGW